MKIPVISLRLTPRLDAEIRARAKANDMAIHAVLIELLEYGLTPGAEAAWLRSEAKRYEEMASDLEVHQNGVDATE